MSERQRDWIEEEHTHPLMEHSKSIEVLKEEVKRLRHLTDEMFELIKEQDAKIRELEERDV